MMLFTPETTILYVRGTTLILYGVGSSIAPISYLRGSVGSGGSPSTGRKLNFCSSVVTIRDSRFLASVSPGQTRLPAPKGNILKKVAMCVIQK